MLKYLNGLRSQGWEKFAHKPPYNSLIETYYLDRPLPGAEELSSTFGSHSSPIRAR
jgi:hypothetical protein